MPLSKKNIHQSCLETIFQKIEVLKKNIADAQQAAAEDTKSSAGDKFETSREMMKQEINKASQQLVIYEKMKSMLTKLNPEAQAVKIGLGSLVHTSEGWYYFSVSIGKVDAGKEKAYVLSLASPLGREALSKMKGDIIDFRGRKIEILDVL